MTSIYTNKKGDGDPSPFSNHGIASVGEAKTAIAPKYLAVLIFAEDATSRHVASALQPFGNTVKIAATLADAVMSASRGNYDVIIAAASDTDTLAAAPGVRTPILALVRGSERTPTCANGLLRWPSPASELYAALKAISVSRQKDTASEPPPSDSVATIDQATFTALEKSVGVTTLIEILKSYIDTAEQLCRALGDASDDANWQEATRLAQDIAGSASGLGLSAMTAAARGFAQAAREGASTHELRNTAQLIVWEHERVRRSLANLYPDLVA